MRKREKKTMKKRVYVRVHFIYYVDIVSLYIRSACILYKIVQVFFWLLQVAPDILFSRC